MPSSRLYRRAFSTLGCPHLDLEQVLALAEAHQFDAVELRALAGTLDLRSYFVRAYGSPAVLAEKMQNRGVKVAALDASLKLVENTAVDFEALVALVPWAEALGVPYLRVFDGGRLADEHELGKMSATLQLWREMKTLRGWKTDLMVETHDSLHTAVAVARLLSLAPNTAILWDSHHTWKLGGEDPLVTWSALRDHIVHIHIKDSIRHGSDLHSYHYALPGEGDFPAAALLGELHRNFTGTVSLEWERHWHPMLPPLEEALRASHDRWLF